MFKDITDFIKELYGYRVPVPLHAPVFSGNEKKYLNDCIDSTFLSYIGEFVTRFEEMTTRYTGAKYSVAIVNGTTALQVALMVAGVRTGDEVITTALTFVATANAVSHSGADNVFIDCSRETLGMCPAHLEEFLSTYTVLKKDGFSYNKISGKRISACVPVHIFGHPCDITSIITICRKFNITVVEDAAESLGSYYMGQHTGTFGKLGILSYNGNKIVTTGGGGMIITNDENLAKKARHITTTAKVPHKYEFFHDEKGFNFRMPNVNAAIGVAQMEKLPEFLENKRNTALQYAEFFNKTGVRLFVEKDNFKSNYWLNSIFFKDRIERDGFLKYSNENGVMTRPAWILMNKLPMYKNCQAGNLENSQWIEDRLVNIPSSVRI
jgi:perosamine synthetase